jgi:hypothetical protein
MRTAGHVTESIPGFPDVKRSVDDWPEHVASDRTIHSLENID